MPESRLSLVKEPHRRHKRLNHTILQRVLRGRGRHHYVAAPAPNEHQLRAEIRWFPWWPLLLGPLIGARSAKRQPIAIDYFGAISGRLAAGFGVGLGGCGHLRSEFRCAAFPTSDVKRCVRAIP